MPITRLPDIVSRPLPKRSASGLTMIEVLITILIVAFGFLGIAGLLFQGLSSGTVSNYRSIAVMQANEIADRIRANKIGMRAGNYDSVSYATVSSCATTCMTGTCSAADIATLDTCLWNAQNQRLMPMGRGSIALVGGNSCTTSQTVCSFDITVSWDENKTGSTGTLSSYTLRVEP